MNAELQLKKEMIKSIIISNNDISIEKIEEIVRTFDSINNTERSILESLKQRTEENGRSTYENIKSDIQKDKNVPSPEDFEKEMEKIWERSI